MKKNWLAEIPLYKVVGFAFLLWVVLLILAQALFILMLVVLAIILAAIMTPVVKFMRRLRVPGTAWRIPKWLAVLIIYLAVAGLLSYVGYSVTVAIATELSSLLASLPGAIQSLNQQIDQFRQSTGLSALLPSAEGLLSAIQSVVANLLSSFSQVQTIVGYLAESIFGFFFVLVLALFLVVESEPLVDFWISLLPTHQQRRARYVTDEVADRVGHWVLGQLTVAIISGIAAGLGVWALGLPYPFLFGVGTTLLDLAPMLGPALMAIPAGLVGLSHSPVVAALAVLLFYGISFIDGHVLTPFITGRFVQLRISLVLISVPLGFALYGALGALIAIPVTAGMVVVTNELLLPWLRARQAREEEDRLAEEQHRAKEKHSTDGPQWHTHRS